MAVPEIKVPTVQPEPTPVTQETEPQLGAFPGAHVGAGLGQVGEALFNVGWEEHQKAVVAVAQDKETEFQKKGEALRDQYRSLHNDDAVKAHGPVSDKLEQLRAEVGNSITSKSGKALYMNNSLRNSRFMQESIDQHFEQQNQSFQKLSYDNEQLGFSRLAAGVAGNPVYKPDDAQAILQKAHDAALENGRLRGLPPNVREEVAQHATQLVAHSLFTILTNRNNPNRDQAKSELEKYDAKGWVDKSIYKDVLGTISAANSTNWARNAFVNLPREDGNHDPDPEGFVPHSAVLALINKIPENDPDKGVKTDALEAEYGRHQESYKKAGDELRNSVMTQGMAAGGGRFVVPKDSLDWQKFQRLYGTMAAMISDRAAGRDWQAWHRGKVSQHEAGREAYGSVRYYLDAQSSEDVKQVTPAQVLSLLARSYHGPGQEPADEEKAKSLEYLKKLQTGKTDPIERQFGQISTQALEQAYKGNRQLVRAAMNRAYYFLDDQYSASVRNGKPKTAAELRSDLVDEFSKKDGIFGFKLWGRPGESYERKSPESRQAPQVLETGSDAWKLFPRGTRFRFKGDPAGKIREIE